MVMLKRSATKTKRAKNFTRVAKTKKATWLDPNWHFKQKFSKALAISPRAQKLIKARPSLPKEVFWNFLRMKRNYSSSVSREGLVLKEINARGSVGNQFLKLSVGKQNFFVKVIENKRLKPNFLPHFDLAFAQFRALTEAKNAVKKLPPHLRKKFSVVSPEFAFVSGKYSFLVTEFVNLKPVNQILHEKKAVSKRVSASMSAFEEASKLLSEKGFLDVHPHNAFFSPKENKFVLFDIRKEYY